MMNSRSALYIAMMLLLVTVGCKKKNNPQPPFSNTPTTALVNPPIKEASGIADSKINTGFLWVQEDGGNAPQLYLMNHAVQSVKKIFLKNTTNRDWEDIALANGPVAGKNYIYLAEIGDNNAVYSSVFFYRFEEPVQNTDTVFAIDRIAFVYSDGARDAEAFLVDPATKDIYIITKRETQSRLYKLAYPQTTNSVNTAVYISSLSYNGVVSAAINTGGTEMIIKTYRSLYYYTKAANTTIEKSLQANYTQLSYQQEPQGEAICFANTNNGFFTLSEQLGTLPQQLYFYSRQ